MIITVVGAGVMLYHSRRNYCLSEAEVMKLNQ
jgi:hypothetical protein